MSLAEEDLSLFYLVTTLSLYSALIPSLVSLLLHLFVWDTPVETSLKRQVSDLKEELGSVNMTDEFAKYSKIKRKLNKASDELKNKNNRQFVYLMKARMILYFVFYSISFLCFGILNWNYYKQPILYFSDNLFYPLGYIFGFPTGGNDCLSIFMWTIISGFVFKTSLNCF